MYVDQSITWESIGGLHSHIESLKEMILLPLLYPEIFTKFNISPPKGVLFFGPPGCGKTLMARALANTCSKVGQPVAFYMRKGADVLSKWVGEAEKQLKLLFEEARKNQPSIIFFDEIDGLAPTRSSKNDQHTGSIVSTLLALMDGLDSRGNVIVIGATNRIDAIDPALRRPGRFDRELTFKLPSKSDREEIFDIHTKDWDPKVSSEVREFICEKSVGYCGADIKALCTEAALFALKRSFPQIYKSQDKLLIDIEKVKISKDDFIKAMGRIVPAAHRNSVVHGRPMPMHLSHLLSKELTNISKLFNKDFSTSLFHPWLLVHGKGNMGQNYISRALLYDMEQFPTFSIGLPTLLSSSFGREEALIQYFAEARKSVPSIIWIPDIHVWWEKSTELMKSSLITMMNDIPSTLQVFILASSEVEVDELPEELKDLFQDKNYQVKCPLEEQRKEMFKYLLEDVQKQPEIHLPVELLPELPLAPFKPVFQISEEKLKEEESFLRDSRIRMRDLILKVLGNRRYEIFVKPHDKNPNPNPNLIFVHNILENINDKKYTSVEQ
jgi:ATPase family AAA domain-containing protein 2